MTTEFKECADCSAKPGSPTLCASCLQNRSAVSELTQLLEEVGSAISCGVRADDFRGIVYTQTFGCAFLGKIESLTGRQWQKAEINGKN